MFIKRNSLNEHLATVNCTLAEGRSLQQQNLILFAPGELAHIIIRPLMSAL
ncbi:MAG: hypothetical protein AAF622_04880 [Cyanobacteria bacterium P01_C01_bin.147]